jgi:kinesin family protein 20
VVTFTCAFAYHQPCRGTDDQVVPFRESKLTSLFQNYFVGKGDGARKGKITMFVNVSNNASAFDETFHVLKFSALTSKVSGC